MVKIIVGPCLLQSPKDVVLAKKLKDVGVDVFRAKPFRGEGTHPPKGLPKSEPFDMLGTFEKIREFMPIATEIQIDLNPVRFDFIWTPSRQMQNYQLLKQLNGNHSHIILKRHFGCTIDEVIGATEYLDMVNDLYICERGIVNFDRHDDSRWLPDFKGILELKQRGYKVIFDASHSAGRREYVLPLAKAALVLGVDGLMIEVREIPEDSWSDQRQCVELKEFKNFMKEIR